MDITILTQYFPPDDGAAASRTRLLANLLADSGHQVTVVAPFPIYPRRIKRADDRYRIIRREKIGKITILHTYIYASQRKNLWGRAIGYASSNLCFLLALPFLRKSDVILAMSAPLFVCVMGYIYSFIWRRPLILEIQDLWPDALFAAGVIKESGFTGRLLKFTERFVYRKAAVISAITRGLQEKIRERVKDPEKVLLNENAWEPEFLAELQQAKVNRESLGWSEKFVLLYAGTVGFLHGAEILVSVAELLREHHKILFTVAGAGPLLTKMKKLIEESELTNIQLIDYVPMEKVANLIVNCDLGVSCLKPVPLNESAFPRKILDYLICGKPILYIGRGEGADFISLAGCGVSISPENPAEIASAILNLATDAQALKLMGLSGREYALKNLSPERLKENYESMLTSLNKSEQLLLQ